MSLKVDTRIRGLRLTHGHKFPYLVSIDTPEQECMPVGCVPTALHRTERGGGSSVQGDLCPGWSVSGGFCTKGLYPGRGSLSGGMVWGVGGGLCPGRESVSRLVLCLEGVSVQEVSVQGGSLLGRPPEGAQDQATRQEVTSYKDPLHLWTDRHV